LFCTCGRLVCDFFAIWPLRFLYLHFFFFWMSDFSFCLDLFPHTVLAQDDFLDPLAVFLGTARSPFFLSTSSVPWHLRRPPFFFPFGHFFGRFTAFRPLPPCGVRWHSFFPSHQKIAGLFLSLNIPRADHPIFLLSKKPKWSSLFPARLFHSPPIETNQTFPCQGDSFNPPLRRP